MLSKPIPKRTGALRGRMIQLGGIDRRHGAPLGSLHDARGAMCDGGTVHGAPSWREVYPFPPTLYPQSMTAVAGGVFAMCRDLILSGNGYAQTDSMRMLSYMEDGSVYESDFITDRMSGENMPLPSDINTHRSMVQFNVYSEEGSLADAIGGKYDKKLLIFPDKMSIDLPVTGSGYTIKRMEEERGDVPDLNFVTVSGGRLFGVDKSRIYAGAYNDPWNWDVDTPDHIAADNAWATTTGADTRGDGDFTAICAYDGGVWAMKDDFGHIVYGESNPFTVKDTDALGAIGPQSVARGDGRLFFVRSDGVRMVEGSSVKVISDPLCKSRFNKGVCAYLDGVLYVADDKLYAYHVAEGTWSILTLPDKGSIVSLAAGENGLYALTRAHIWEHYIYLLDGAPVEWEAELSPVDFGLDTDKGPATLTLHANTAQGAKITVTLTETLTGKTVPLGTVTGVGGNLRFRTLIRGGAGHGYSIRITVSGTATIRGVSLTARNGVRDGG